MWKWIEIEVRDITEIVMYANTVDMIWRVGIIGGGEDGV